jgi:8-oxo-dGTP pyrophosphatase MutT (NUDIX family)
LNEPPLLSLVPEWQLGDDTTLAETRIFTLRQRRATSPARPDTPGDFVYLDSADWVNVIALTAAREVVLIEQYRHGTNEVTLEIPGGMVDPGEAPLAAGVRELAEETGYGSEQAELIGSVTPNPAILNNRCYTALVSGVELRGATALDLHEEIGMRLVPLTDIAGLIRDGHIHHALVIAAFHHLTLREDGR